MAATAKTMTLDEFLAMPETEPPSEFINGEVVQKSMPTFLHTVVANVLGALLFTYLRASREGAVGNDPRHAQRAEGRAYLPALSVILRSRLRRGEIERGPIEHVPDIAIEILSPDDRPGRVAEKVAFYLRAGTPLVWVLDPIERTLDVHRPDGPSSRHGLGDSLDARPVLQDFVLDLDELFGLVDEALQTEQ